jgi:hypothetical protein
MRPRDETPAARQVAGTHGETCGGEARDEAELPRCDPVLQDSSKPMATKAECQVSEPQVPLQMENSFSRGDIDVCDHFGDRGVQKPSDHRW